MATLHDRAVAAENPIFRQRVRQALVAQALTALAAQGSGDPDVKLAKQVLAAPDQFAALVAIAAAQAPALGDGTNSDPTQDPAGDGALQSLVAGQLWPALVRQTKVAGP